MKLQNLFISSLALLSACNTSSLPSSKRVYLDYNKANITAEQQSCIDNCKRISIKCSDYNMHGDAILSESNNTNQCILDEAKCIEACGIEVETKEKYVDIFGFSYEPSSHKENQTKTYSKPSKAHAPNTEKAGKTTTSQTKALEENNIKTKNKTEKKEDNHNNNNKKSWNIFKNYKRSESFENF